MEIAVLAYANVFDSGLAAVLDVLETANAMRGRLDPAPPAWTVVTVGPDPQVRTGAGHLVAARPLDDAAGADLLVVPALSKREPAELIAQVSGAELDPVRKAVVAARERGTPVYSACTGSFLLAEAGILDGQRATTSWWLSPVFRARYPEVELDQTKMLVAGDGVTTAGAAFGHLDLALAIVRLVSPALADLVASYLVIDERPSQSAYTITSALAHSDPTLAAFERWARDRLADPITIAEAARALGLSERTLQRTVQRTLGISPLRFIQDLRVEQASHLIKTTTLPLEAIARKVGYEHATTLRTLLRERTGHTTRTLRRA
jgi:transcriptional regulator GlxA family with amidase domain